jgi:hypothetical protein
VAVVDQSTRCLPFDTRPSIATTHCCTVRLGTTAGWQFCIAPSTIAIVCAAAASVLTAHNSDSHLLVARSWPNHEVLSTSIIYSRSSILLLVFAGNSNWITALLQTIQLAMMRTPTLTPTTNSQALIHSLLFHVSANQYWIVWMLIWLRYGCNTQQATVGIAFAQCQLTCIGFVASEWLDWLGCVSPALHRHGANQFDPHHGGSRQICASITLLITTQTCRNNRIDNLALQLQYPRDVASAIGALCDGSTAFAVALYHTAAVLSEHRGGTMRGTQATHH